MTGFAVIEDAPLARWNGFGLPARARRLVCVYDTGALPEAVRAAGATARVLGHGSNVLMLEPRQGALIQLRTRGLRCQALAADRVRVVAEAGIRWHSLVRWCLRHGLYGVENLALIPGTVGAAPVQNIGAYGVELERVLEAVEVYDRWRQRFAQLTRHDCALAYRDSVFKHQPGRYLITRVHLLLHREASALVLDYAGLREELTALGVSSPRPLDVARAVVRLRQRKLPDPRRLGNLGSFFKNPILPRTQAEQLWRQFPNLPHWPFDAQRSKLSAAWMIEHLGYKGLRRGDAGVHAQHALVLVNHGGATGAELHALADEIQSAVATRFGVALEIEPERW